MNVQKIASLTPIDRREFLEVSAGSLVLGAVGCSRDGGEPGSLRGSTVIVAYPREKNMDPESDEVPKFLVFLPLLTENEKGDLEGCLAERWEHSPDYREWTFHLRRGVRWHDGTPVTAHDVKFTMKLLTDVQEFGPGAIESVTVLDDSTVTIRYGDAYTTSTLSWEVCYPKHLLEHLDPKKVTTWDFWMHPVGNGPYRFTRYVPQTLTEFEANPEYFRGKPRINRVILKYFGNGLTELVSGNVDIIMYAEPGDATALSRVPAFRAYHGFNGIGLSTLSILWQNAHPLFQDARVRRALTLAINRREMIQLLNFPETLPVVDAPYTRRQLRRGGLAEPLPYDQHQAKALLDAAGYRELNRDGVRMRDGTPFHFVLLVGSRPLWLQIAVYLREQLRRVGVLMDIRAMDQSLVRRALAAGKFDAVLNNTPWSAGGLQRLFGENSFIGYHNSAMATRLRRLTLVSDPDEQDRLRSELAQIFRAEVPATFLFPAVEIIFAHRRIRGLSTPWRADPIRLMGELWIDNRSDQ